MQQLPFIFSNAAHPYLGKKIAFGDNLKVRFLSGFRKVLYTFLHHEKLIGKCIVEPKIDDWRISRGSKAM